MDTAPQSVQVCGTCLSFLATWVLTGPYGAGTAAQRCHGTHGQPHRCWRAFQERGSLREGAELPLGSGARLQTLHLAGSRPPSVASDGPLAAPSLSLGAPSHQAPLSHRPGPLLWAPHWCRLISRRFGSYPCHFQCDRLASGLLGVPCPPLPRSGQLGPPCPPLSPVTLGVGPGHSRHPLPSSEDRDVLRGPSGGCCPH